MMQTIQGIVNNITVQLIEVLSVFKNMFLGFLIAVYLLASRKLFGAQAKLLLYGVFPNKWAKIIEEEVRYTDKMFNGFFVGKMMRELKGKASPDAVREALVKEVEKRKNQ